jgi:RimJ/RimL family protein N-acetyltransferase
LGLGFSPDEPLDAALFLPYHYTVVMQPIELDKFTLQNAPKLLETERLWLKAPDPAFAAQFADAIKHSVEDFFFIAWWVKCQEEGVARVSLENSVKHIAAGDCVVWHAFEKLSDRYIGRLDLHTWDFDTPRCELGYMADSRMNGRGLMREAALALMRWAFNLGVVRIQAITDARNLRSIHFAECIGMQREGVLRSYELDSEGELCDQVVLARVQVKI